MFKKQIHTCKHSRRKTETDRQTETHLHEGTDRQTDRQTETNLHEGTPLLAQDQPADLRPLQQGRPVAQPARQARGPASPA